MGPTSRSFLYLRASTKAPSSQRAFEASTSSSSEKIALSARQAANSHGASSTRGEPSTALDFLRAPDAHRAILFNREPIVGPRSTPRPFLDREVSPAPTPLGTRRLRSEP